ncbi:MAG TPA: MBL fold metallo-hydrolase [bacterium]|nr:MBL fold metallo-hydrolase [bacterium]
MFAATKGGFFHVTGLRSGVEGVGVDYLGHSALLLTTPSGLRVAIDPYGNPSGSEPRWFIRPCPRVACDILLITHPHFDHDAVDRVAGDPTILRGPLELRGDGVRIRGVMSRHARHFGEEFGQRNIIFLIEAAGITFCHPGDSRADLPPETRAAVGRVDVLIVPVDESQHLLTYAEADQFISRLAPKVAIPVHYLIPGLTDPASSLQGIDGWLRIQSNVRRLDAGHVDLSQADLPVEGNIWSFGTHTAGATPDRSSGRPG